MISFLKTLLFNQSPFLKEVGFAIIRVGIGSIFIRHGIEKLMQGPQTWQWLGSQMAIIGISFFPTFWGLCAASAEFIGGCALVLGLATRLASAFLVIVMAIALAYHINKGDSFQIFSHALAMLVIFIGLMISGGGRFSADWFLR
jgi:putative oxidoreductase